jgi:hypothetical protein
MAAEVDNGEVATFVANIAAKASAVNATISAESAAINDTGALTSALESTACHSGLSPFFHAPAPTHL